MSPLLLLLISMQPGAGLRGTVRAEESLEPIPYAAIEVLGTGRTALADVHGRWVVPSLTPGTYAVRAGAPGYAAAVDSIQVRAGRTILVHFRLAPLPFELEALQVEGVAGSSAAGVTPARVDAELIDRLPAAGEADVLRTLQILPSVQSISDFSSALYVRGGSSDQNLIRLDGAPLFNPYHLGGIFAAIDPDAVASVDVFPGAMPASLGDRLSSQVDIWTRQGGRDRVRGTGSIGLISKRAGLDGPMPGLGGTFLLSVRRTYLDLLTRVLDGLGAIDGTLPYHFTDVHAKLTRDAGADGSLSVSLYLDDEILTNEDLETSDERLDDRFRWRSRAASVGWRGGWGGAWSAEARAAYSVFSSDIQFFDRPFSPTEGNSTVRQTMDGRVRLRDALIGVDLTYFRARHEIRLGVETNDYALAYDVTRAEDTFFADLLPEFDRDDGLTTLAGWLEDTWSPWERGRLRFGARVLHAAGQTLWMPRFGIEAGAGNGWTARIGGGRYAQPLRNFRDDEALLSSFLAYDVLAPTDTFGLATSWDVVGAIDWRVGRSRVLAEAYHKSLNNLVMPSIPLDPTESPLLSIDDLQRANGFTRGVEVTARREWGDAGFVQLAGSLSQSERRVGGLVFTPRFHRALTVDGLVSAPFGASGTVSARVVFGSGQPYAPPIGLAGGVDPALPDGGLRTGIGGPLLRAPHNSGRLPSYWRTDVSLRKAFDKRWFGAELTVTPYLHVINLFNTRNVLFAEPEAFGPLGAPQLEFLPQIPILPTVGVEWRF